MQYIYRENVHDFSKIIASRNISNCQKYQTLIASSSYLRKCELLWTRKLKQAYTVYSIDLDVLDVISGGLLFRIRTVRLGSQPHGSTLLDKTLIKEIAFVGCPEGCSTVLCINIVFIGRKF